MHRFGKGIIGLLLIATPSFANAEGSEIVSCATEHPELDASQRTELAVLLEAHNVWLQAHNRDREVLVRAFRRSAVLDVPAGDEQIARLIRMEASRLNTESILAKHVRAILTKEHLEQVALLADNGMSLARSVDVSTKLGKLTF